MKTFIALLIGIVTVVGLSGCAHHRHYDNCDRGTYGCDHPKPNY